MQKQKHRLFYIGLMVMFLMGCSNEVETPDPVQETTTPPQETVEKSDTGKPLLKETIQTEKDGKKVITNPDSLLACINKERSLPEDYVPKDLVMPNIPFSYADPERFDKSLMRKEAAEAIEKLFAAAKKEGIRLYGISGYRSYVRQEAVFASNVKQYGGDEKKANQFSALPGESEHQTGLTMDVSAESVGFALVQHFGETKEGKWLFEHAADYGFIIRYLKGKENLTGYQYEPWHIRYVGVEPAQEIMSKGITLEEYLSQ